MYPPKFDYYRAGTLDEAVALLQQHAGAKVLAGGHSLIPAMKLRLADPGTLIDIGRIADGGEPFVNRAGGWDISALATHAQIERTVRGPGFEAFAETAGGIGDPQVRNRGTIGGNIAHADPASDWPTVLVAFRAIIQVVGPGGQREIEADDFFVDLFQTALDEGEIITRIRVPALNAPSNHGVGSAYAKMENPASRYSLVGAAAVVQVENGVCRQASVAVGGLTPKATRASAVEAVLAGQALTADRIQAAAAKIVDDLGDEVNGDIHASADYRRAMAPIYVARALTAAAARAG
jgi:aerobic carbon-monoxide dehydrogenase medium subunit